MRKKYLRFLCLCLLASLLISALASCGEEATTTAPVTEEKEETTEQQTVQGLSLIEGGKANYKIIYEENADSSVMTAIGSLKKTVKAVYGATLTDEDDFLGRGESEDLDALEILVGDTNRQASQSVAVEKGEYTLLLSGKKLVVKGGSDKDTADAVAYLESLMTEGDSFTFTEAMCYSHKEAERPTYVSFYGDSITTYAEVSNNATYNKTLSTNANWFDFWKMQVTQTWWYQVKEAMGWTLLVNNSYSGGCATSSHAPTRAVQLHNEEGISPDKIIVYYGINDYKNGEDVDTFTSAYYRILSDMKDKYPDADIYVCTLMPIDYPSFSCTPTQNKNGVLESAFNDGIKSTASRLGLTVIDLNTLVGNAIIEQTIDGLHPNVYGMETMANAVISALNS